MNLFIVEIIPTIEEINKRQLISQRINLAVFQRNGFKRAKYLYRTLHPAESERFTYLNTNNPI